MSSHEEKCFSSDCLVEELHKNEDKTKNTNSSVEIRLFGHSSDKVFYKRLTEFELSEIRKILKIT